MIDEISDKQHCGAWFKNIITYLMDGTFPDDKKLSRQILITHSFEIDIHLYTLDKKKLKNSEIPMQICVPKVFVKTLLEEMHDSLLTVNHMVFIVF